MVPGMGNTGKSHLDTAQTTLKPRGSHLDTAQVTWTLHKSPGPCRSHPGAGGWMGPLCPSLILHSEPALPNKPKPRPQQEWAAPYPSHSSAGEERIYRNQESEPGNNVSINSLFFGAHRLPFTALRKKQ